MNRFIGRRKELEFLEEKYSSKKGELVFVYGRRRIGKTEVLNEFSRNKHAVFYTCTQVDDRQQLKSFSSTVYREFQFSKYNSVFENWEKAFSSVLDIPPNDNGKRMLIIDEFPYSVMSNPAIGSILQKVWDQTLRRENVLIILCGSSMSFIEKEILGEKNPLYGRATGIYKMEEMTFFDAVEFLDGFNEREKMTIYSICGGVPYYLEMFSSSRSLKDNIVSNTLRKGAVLYSETEFLLHQELREPGRYNAIISSVAMGRTKFSEIVDETQIEKSKLSVYMKNLVELGIVERELPVAARMGGRTNPQRGIYKIKNAFFRYWYRFAFPNMTLLEFGDSETVYDKLISPELDVFTSLSFEAVCIEYLIRMNARHKLPFIFTDIGRWWNKEAEVDALAVDRSGNMISGECKYRKRKADKSDLKKHIEKDKYLDFDREKGRIYHFYFSFSGFEEDAVLYGREKGVQLVCAEDIFGYAE